MRALLLAALLPVSLLAQGIESGPAHPITLDEAIRLARQNSPTTIQARNAVGSQDLAVRAAYAAFFPSLSVSWSGSKSLGSTSNPNGTLGSIAIPWSFSRGWSTSLTLFDAGRQYFNLQSAQANRRSAESSERAAQYNVALNVSTQYFAALAAGESRVAAQAQLEEAQANLQSAVARIAAGAATRSDSLRAVISLGSARLAILQADNNLANANAALTRLVATPFTVTPTPEDSSTMTAESFVVDSAALMQALNDAPTVVSARMSVEASKSAVRAARTSYFPTLSLSYGGSGRKTSEGFNYNPATGFSSSSSLSLRMSLSLWDGFSRENNVQNASLQQMNARAQMRDATLLAQQNLLQYLNQLRVAQTQIMINQASLEAAQEDLRVQQQRYSLGASTQLELLTTQQALNAARYNLVSARFTARNAVAQIEALLGRQIR